MKTTRIFLLLFLSLSISYCSKSDDSPRDCLFRVAYVSDNCDCDWTDFECSPIYFVTEMDYNRLMNILNESLELCIYVNEKDNQGNAFEGYL